MGQEAPSRLPTNSLLTLSLIQSTPSCADAEEYNGRAHEQQALATRKFDCGGAERQLPIVDAASMMPTNAPSYG